METNIIYMEPIILASESPRRKELFELMGLPFTCMSPDIDESILPGCDPRNVVKEFAIKKVEKIVDTLPDNPLWVCGADTLVSLDGIIYGKADNRSEAKETLSALQGKTHEVLTAIALYSGKTGKTDCRIITGNVTFASLNSGEIDWYVDTEEWKGAAGAYRIQGKASCFITEIQGQYSTIMGLPLREFYVMLRDNNYPYGG